MCQKPKISILCLCYNHVSFLEQALTSVDRLTYSNLEVLLADDNSSDGSIEILRLWQKRKPNWDFTFHQENKGNCFTFNELLKRSSGDYVIDFSTDDILINETLEGWVNHLNNNPKAGFCYADAWIFEKEIKRSSLFSSTNSISSFPAGNILTQLLGKPFICPPAVLFRKSALVQVGGYNENLAYEDLDIWLRIAREFEVVGFREPVIFYRKHKGSMSASLFIKRNEKLIQSTILIVESLIQWDEFKNGNPQLIGFIRYHIKISGALQLTKETLRLAEILERYQSLNFKDWFWILFSKFKLPFYHIIMVWKRLI